MVNNYIKDGLVPRADGKRYGPVHLGYLTAVCALKKVLPVRDIGALLSAGQQTGKDNETLYHYFCAALDRALTDTAQTIDGDAQRGAQLLQAVHIPGGICAKGKVIAAEHRLGGKAFHQNFVDEIFRA